MDSEANGDDGELFLLGSFPPVEVDSPLFVLQILQFFLGRNTSKCRRNFNTHSAQRLEPSRSPGHVGPTLGKFTVESSQVHGKIVRVRRSGERDYET